MIELTIIAVVAMLCGTVIYLKRPAPKTGEDATTDRLSNEIATLKIQVDGLRATMNQLQLKEGMRR